MKTKKQSINITKSDKMDKINQILTHSDAKHISVRIQETSDVHSQHIFYTVVPSEKQSLLTIIDYYDIRAIISCHWVDSQGLIGLQYVLEYDTDTSQLYFVDCKPALNISESLAKSHFQSNSLIKKPTVYFGDRISHWAHPSFMIRKQINPDGFTTCFSLEERDYMVLQGTNNHLYFIAFYDRYSAVRMIEFVPEGKPLSYDYNEFSPTYEPLWNALKKLSCRTANLIRDIIQDWERAKIISENDKDVADMRPGNESEVVGISKPQAIREQLNQCMAQSKETIVSEQEFANSLVKAWIANFDNTKSLNKALQEQLQEHMDLIEVR